MWFLVFSFHLGGISWQLVRFASFFPIGGGFGSLEPFWKLKLIKICILAPVAKTLQGRESSVDFYEGVIISTNLSCVLFSICPAPPHLLRHLPGVLIGRTVFNAWPKGTQGSPSPPKNNTALFLPPFITYRPTPEWSTLLVSHSLRAIKLQKRKRERGKLKDEVIECQFWGGAIAEVEEDTKYVSVLCTSGVLTKPLKKCGFSTRQS